MATVEVRPQYMLHLDRANVARLAAAALKRELAAGTMTVGEALADERSGPIMVLDLLAAQHRWGRWRAVRLLDAMEATYPANRISETKRVRELTARQKALLAAWCAR
jgi:hypothetical protein